MLAILLLRRVLDAKPLKWLTKKIKECANQRLESRAGALEVQPKLQPAVNITIICTRGTATLADSS